MTEQMQMPLKRRRRGRAGIILLLLLALLAAAVLCSPAQLRKRVYVELSSVRYPDDVLALARSNPDALDFVIGWTKSIEGDYTPEAIDLSADVTPGETPLLLQWDARWGYATYGTNVMGLAGCAPTCLSMAVIGLRGDLDANPLAVARYSESQGWYVPGVGTAWDLLSDGAAHFGLTAERMEPTRENMLAALDSGKLLIASMLPGDFTSAGHFIVIPGYEAEGFHVLDPNSPTRSEKLWGYSVLKDQIAAVWAYS